MSESDQPVTDGAGTEPASEPVADVTTSDVEDFLDSLDLSAESFPREYVEKIRNEAASYRTKYAPYRDIFGEVPDDVREYILQDVVAPLVGSNPAAALDELYDLVERIHGIDQSKPRWAQQAAEHLGEETKPDIAPEKPKYLTEEDWRNLQAEERRQQEEADAVEQILAGAESLGYHRTGELGDDMASLLYLSTHVTKGDIQKAHEIRAERFASAVEAEVERRLADIKNGALKWPPVSSTGAAPAERDEGPKTFADANRRAKARLDAYFNQ